MALFSQPIASTRVSRRSHGFPIACLVGLASLTGPAGAEALLEPAPPPSRHTTLFGTVDTGRSIYAAAGFKHGLFDPLDRSGYVLIGMAGGGRERPAPRLPLDFRQRGPQPEGEASLLVGHQWLIGWGAITVAAGPELTFRNPLIGSDRARASGRVMAEAWLYPTPGTLLIATATAGSARPHVWGRVALGWQAPDWLRARVGHGLGWLLPEGAYAGPEIAIYREDGRPDWRLGGHVTGWKIGPASARLSAGWRKDTDGREGGYATLGLHAPL